jgi:hypothetical protein
MRCSRKMFTFCSGEKLRRVLSISGSMVSPLCNPSQPLFHFRPEENRKGTVGSLRSSGTRPLESPKTVFSAVFRERSLTLYATRRAFVLPTFIHLGSMWHRAQKVSVPRQAVGGLFSRREFRHERSLLIKEKGRCLSPGPPGSSRVLIVFGTRSDVGVRGLPNVQHTQPGLPTAYGNLLISKLTEITAGTPCCVHRKQWGGGLRHPMGSIVCGHRFGAQTLAMAASTNSRNTRTCGSS